MVLLATVEEGAQPILLQAVLTAVFCPPPMNSRGAEVFSALALSLTQ